MSESNPVITQDLLLAIIAFFVPPLPVFIKTGCGADLLINVLLTLIGGVPGVVHAWYVVLKNPTDGIPFISEGLGLSAAHHGGASGYERIDEESHPERAVDAHKPDAESAVEPPAYSEGEGSSSGPVPHRASGDFKVQSS